MFIFCIYFLSIIIFFCKSGTCLPFNFTVVDIVFEHKPFHFQGLCALLSLFYIAYSLNY